jgi:hypothetical protein
LTTHDLTTVFTLLVAFQLAHFIADYPLQSNKFMLGKFRPGWGFFFPLLAHAAVHAAFTFSIVTRFSSSLKLAFGLAAFDGTIHFLMDRVKSGPRWMGRWKPLSPGEYMTVNIELACDDEGHQESAKRSLLGNKLFWNALGFDQMVHHLTHYVCIWAILRGGFR